MSGIPAEALYDLTRITDVAVSPTGERIAFLTRESDPDAEERVRSLWVVPADGSRDPHRLTRASDASSPAWSPDGSKLAFLAVRDRDPDLRVGRDSARDGDTDGDAENEDTDAEDDSEEGEEETGEEMQVWVFDMQRGGDARQVTDREDGVSSFDWGPTGERVVVAARDPTDEQREYLDQREDDGPIEVERLQHKFDGQGYLDEVVTYLFVVDLDSRETTRLGDANDGGNSFLGGLAPAWAPGDRIAFVANHTDWPDDNYVRDIYTIAPDGSDRRKVTGGELCAQTLAWGPDGNRLAFTARDPENWYAPTEMYVTDEREYRSLSEGLDRTLGFGVVPQWLDDQRLLGLIADEGRTRLAHFHLEEGPRRVFETQDDMETLATLAVGGSTAAVQSVSPAEAELDAADVDALCQSNEGDPRVRLTDLTDPELAGCPPPGCRRFTFDGAGGDEVEGLLVHPADWDPDGDRRGVVLDIHGGPMAYDAPSFRFKDRYFTSRDYLVCRINYHGSTSYGREFCESLRGQWGTLEVEDLLAGVDELLDRGWADPHRLFPTGFSQGGVNTAYLVTRSNRWAAAAAEHGIYDLRSSFGTDDSQNWLEADFGLPWENPDGFDQTSPITDVDAVETPLLVAAGENDWRCPPSQAEQLYVSVRKQGVDAKLVIYPGEHHNVGDPDRAVHRLETLDKWFARYDPARETPESSDGSEG